MQRLRAPGTPRVAAYLLTFITHEIERWKGKKPLFRDFHHNELAEECGCGVSSISRAVAWLRDNGKLYIVRTGRRNRYHLHAPPAIIEDRLPEDAPMFKNEHSECSKVNIGEQEENASNNVPDSPFEAPVPSPKELELKNLKAESKNPPSEPSANVGAKREDKKLESLTPPFENPDSTCKESRQHLSKNPTQVLSDNLVKSPPPSEYSANVGAEGEDKKSKSLTPETPTTSTPREVSEDIRSETPEAAICRLSPAAHATFAEVMQAQSFPSENPVRAAQAKAVRDHLDEDIAAGRGVEPVTGALQKTLACISDLRNPMLYFAAELSRRRTTNRESSRRPLWDVSGGDRQNINHPDYRLVRGQEVPEGFRRRLTEDEGEDEAQERKQALRKQADMLEG